jgi:hypothetical protein
MKLVGTASLGAIALVLQVLFCANACAGSEAASSGPPTTQQGSLILDLNDVIKNPGSYTWFDFRPNLKKMILAGTADGKHVCILRYPTADGKVGLHYHAKTESVYVIEGAQTDVKGTYPAGTVYFNPPGSGHAVKDSMGYFILAYASPPDFTNTALIGQYTPVRIDTESADLESKYPFESKGEGIRVFSVPLDPNGDMHSQFIDAKGKGMYSYSGNYLIVIKGACVIEGVVHSKGTMVVAPTVTPKSYQIGAAGEASCLAMGVSF